MFLVHSAGRSRFGAWAGRVEGVLGMVVDLSPKMSTMRFKRYSIACNLEISHDILNLAWNLYSICKIDIERKLHMFDQFLGFYLTRVGFPYFTYARKRIGR